MADLRNILNQIEDDASKASIVESTIVNFDIFTRIFEAI